MSSPFKEEKGFLIIGYVTMIVYFDFCLFFWGHEIWGHDIL